MHRRSNTHGGWWQLDAVMCQKSRHLHQYMSEQLVVQMKKLALLAACPVDESPEFWFTSCVLALLLYANHSGDRASLHSCTRPGEETGRCVHQQLELPF